MATEERYDFAVSCRTCRPSEINSPERLRLIKRTGLLKGQHPELDRITKLASDLLDVPIVLVSFVDIDRQVFCSETGLPEPVASERQTPLTHSFCQHVVTQGKPLIVEDATCDERVRDNLAIKDLGVVAYAGYPIVSQEQVLGSFCGIYPSAREWSELELELLSQFANTVSDQISLRLEMEESQKMQETLQRSNDELRGLADVLAHDLKAPLRGIKGMLELLQMEISPLSGEAKDFFELVMGSAGRMTNMIEALNKYSKAFAHRRVMQDVDLDKILAALTQDLMVDLETNNAKLVVRDSLGIVRGYPVLIRQLLQNLIVNGLKFQPRDGKPIIEVGKTSDDTYWVKDNGIGIPEKSLNSIFGVYQRLDRESDTDGTGMGLAICSRVVSEHKGKIWAESKTDRGSTFFFTLACSSVGGERGVYNLGK